jgi:hypothetical protein
LKSFSIFILCLFATFFSFSQEEYKRIAIIPFERFSFESLHELDSIAACNGLANAEEVYENYVREIALHISDSTNLTFFILSESDLVKINTSLPKVYKYKPISHFGVDIEPLVENGLLKQISESMKVDAFLFLTKYKIDSKLLSTRKSYGGSKYLNWSSHELDYELYNVAGDLMALANKFILRPKNPNDETYSCKGTILEGMYRSYSKIGKDVEVKIKKYSQKKKPIYKIKTK